MRTKEQWPDRAAESETENYRNSVKADQREIGRKMRHSTAGIEKGKQFGKA